MGTFIIVYVRTAQHSAACVVMIICDKNVHKNFLASGLSSQEKSFLINCFQSIGKGWPVVSCNKFSFTAIYLDCIFFF